MEFRQVETFRTVAEELSFSRAAAKLGYAQSSVSAQVAALERDLGVPLFDRLGRGIALTGAGEVMLSHSRRLLALAEETRAAVADAGVVGSGEVAGSLVVSAPETLLTYRLPRLLALFQERHPRVRLSVRPRAVGRLVGSARRAVEEGGVDVAFVLDETLGRRSDGSQGDHLGDRPPSVGLATEDLVEEEIVVISPSAHALASSSRVVPADLAGETLLLPEAPESGCAYRGQFERQLGAAGVVPSEKMEFQSIEAVKRCVAAGMGVSVLPSVAVEGELRSGELCALPWVGAFDVRTRMAWHRERWQSPALRTFLEAAREVFGLVAASGPGRS